MRLVPAILALLLAAPAAGQQPAPAAPVKLPALSAEQAGALRCGVGFAIVHRLQADGAPEGAKFPAMGDRGREYFVRTAAKIMDETGADRAAIGELVARQLQDFGAARGLLAETIPGCLVQLEAAGL